MTKSRSLAGCVVFVVEDDYFQADALRRACELNGAEVLGPVGRLEEAMYLIDEAARIDAAVLDINLHEVMVFPLADTLRARGVPFVFASGYELGGIPTRFADVLRFEKPVEPEKIAEALFR